jgi:fructoselysine 6-kinase
MTARLLTVGDNVVDQYPERGLFFPGGNAVNVSVHARRLGAVSAYIGAVGTDRAGEVVLGSLAEEGVDVSRTRVIDGPNAYAVVYVVDGNRVFGHGDLGVSVFECDDDDVTAARDFDLVHTGECSHIEAQVPELAGTAKRLSYDFSERDWAYIASLATHIDIAVRSMPGADRQGAVDEARRIQALGPRTVAITLGAGGAVIVHEDEEQWAPAPSGVIVDTLGAGDAFIARFLLGMIEEEPIAELAVAATAYATASCATFGAFGRATPLEAPGSSPSSTSTSPTPAQHHPDRLDVS